MGTFHQDRGELHGITIVVDTDGPTVYVGRCDEIDDDRVVLLDVDVHEESRDGLTKAEYLERAARFGVWKAHDRLVVPRSQVARVVPLGEYPQKADDAPRKQKTVVSPTPVSATNERKAVQPAPVSTANETTASKVRASGANSLAVVTLTENACAEVARLLAAENREGAGLRLGVTGGGCSGLSYKLEFDTRNDHDTVIDYSDFHVYLDPKSVIYLRGVSLDYQKGLSGKGFVFHNPNATNTCGCGESFSV